MTMESYQAVKSRMIEAHNSAALSLRPSQLLAVSKRQEIEKIQVLLEAGHRLFGENQVQEVAGKWPELKKNYPDIQLHLIGPLQSNKAAQAVALFDVIGAVDREKIVRVLAKEMRKQGRNLPCFVEVNIAEEPQKHGVAPNDLPAFLALCTKEGLDVRGLMCVPPAGEPPAPYFALLRHLAQPLRTQNGAPLQLSMGMSGDFETAITFGADIVRVGTALFGKREG